MRPFGRDFGWWTSPSTATFPIDVSDRAISALSRTRLTRRTGEDSGTDSNNVTGQKLTVRPRVRNHGIETDRGPHRLAGGAGVQQLRDADRRRAHAGGGR